MNPGIEFQTKRKKYPGDSVFAGPFAALPVWIFRAGYWAELSGSEAKILGAIAHFSDNRTHRCGRSRKTLAEETGVHQGSIGRITNKLRDIGIIKKWRVGYRVYYEVQFKEPDWITERNREGLPFRHHPYKAPKKTVTYIRDRGRFVRRIESTDDGGTDAIDFGEIDVENNGDCLESREEHLDKDCLGDGSDVP